MSNKKLKGHPIPFTELNLLLYGKMDPDSVDFSPKEKEILKRFTPKISNRISGKVIITSSTNDNNNYFKKLWEDGNT